MPNLNTFCFSYDNSSDLCETVHGNYFILILGIFATSTIIFVYII
jgi:hypothetical protein